MTQSTAQGSLPRAHRRLRLHGGEHIRVIPASERFLERLREALTTLMARGHYSVLDLAGEVCLSRRQLYRKIKDLTDETPGELMRRFRMERVALLLREEAGTISEIAYATGFRSPCHLSRCFKSHFGVCPRAYSAQTARPARGLVDSFSTNDVSRASMRTP